MSFWDILLIDKSGSMFPNIKTIKEGFENLVKEQKEQGSKNKFTLIGFNQDIEILKDEYFPNISDLSDRDLAIKGLTAIYDAIGYVYDLIIKENRLGDITVTIISDGYENASRYYDAEKIEEKRKIIEKNYRLNFMFIGTDQKCIDDNASIIKHISNFVNCNGDMYLAMRTVSRNMSDSREKEELLNPGIKRSRCCKIV